MNTHNQRHGNTAGPAGPPGDPDRVPEPAGVPEGFELPSEAYAAALAGLPEMGSARLTALLHALSPAEAWSRLRSPGLGDTALEHALGSPHQSLIVAWRDAASSITVSDVWQRVTTSGQRVALHGGPGYPSALAGDIEAPRLLFSKGRLDAITAGRRVAIIGTRRCTSSGSGVAFELGRDLATSGVVVVSGLATGIDSAAHRGVLQARKAPPVGVAATGLDVIYPSRQRELWSQVAETGVLIGEAPPGTHPERWRFPARNRIIAALAEVVVVVESHDPGGALHVVDHAARRSVEVVALPGSVRSPASKGTNRLLVEGRAAVRDASDVLAALARTAATPTTGPGSGVTGGDGHDPST